MSAQGQQPAGGKSIRPGWQAQLAFVAVLSIVSIAMLIEAWRIEGWPGWASAGAFPLAMAAIMLLSLLWEAVRLWRRAESGSAFRPYLSGNWLGLVALGLGFVVLLDTVGFIGAGVLFLWTTVVFLHRGRPWFALMLAVGITALIYALFTWVFKVSLP